MTTNFSDPRVPSHFEGFCGGRFWDLDLTWYTTDPDFTPCFQRTVLVWIPCVWLILAAPFEISTLRKASNKVTPWTLLNITRLVLCFVLVLLPFVDLVYGIFRSPLGDLASADYWALTLRLLSTAWAIGCVMEERKRGIPPTAPTSVFFFLLTLCSAITYRSYLMGNGILEASMYGPLPTITYLLYFPVVAIVLMLFCVSDTKAVPQDDEAEKEAVKAKSKGSDTDGGECPETYAPFFSRIVFSWSSSLIYRGYKTPLTLVDVWKARDKLRADAQYPRFARIWEKQRRKTSLKSQQASAKMKLVSDDQARRKDMDTTKSPLLFGKTSKKSYGSTASKTSIISKPHVSVMAVVFSFALGAIVRSSLFSIISDLIGFVSPLLLQLLIEFTYSDDPIWKGLLYASLIPVAVAIYSICLHGFFKMALVTGMNVKTSLISALYRKALKLSNAARRQSTVGEIVNLMAVDAQRVMETAFVVDMIWSFPLILGITTALLWVQIGPSSLAGLGLMALLVPLNTLIARKSRKYQMEQMKLKDDRLKLMTEILNGIKVLKLYAWEDSFGKQIENIREKEISILKKDAYLNAVNNFVWICAPYMVSLVTFATFILSDETNILDATTAFVSIALFNILKFPMALLPYLVANFVQASVSIKRLHKFLNAEELDPTSADKHADDPFCEFPIRINHGTFSWGIDEPAVLHDITVKIPRGKLTAVVGTVGCGKSSLLSAFLGEMDRLSGTADINGSTAYVAQEAWIRNLSLRENILCGQKYDRKKYREVVQAAALQPDIDILIAGDETEIGEKGVNLSGGQKQRVAVARAVYSDRDVYLFDDPLSAVDAHVGKHIFQQVIGPKGILADKTRVLVTHGISHLPSADRIVVLIHGRISEQGTYKELMDMKGAFADYILQYLSAVEEEIGNEAEDPESEEDLKRIQRELEEKLGKEQVQRRISESRSQLSTSMSGEVVSSSSRAYYSSKDFTKPLGHEAAAAEARSRREPTKSGKRVTFRENQRSSTSSAVASRHDESEVDSGSGAKKPRKGLHGTLIEEEASETGGVKGEVFVRYFRAMGWLLFIATIFAYIASQAAAVFANVWLSDWSNSNEGVNSTTLGPEFRERNLYYLWVYGVVGAGQGIFIITGAILMALGSLRASKLMHDRMLENILQSPMSFFDTTPVGRINNRFGKDLDTMDVAIPRSVISMLNNLFLVFATLVVNTVTTPWFIAAVLPVAIFYVVAQRVYAASARQLRRLHSVTQSPMYSNFGESIVGGPTIRAFQLQKAFIKESDKKLDTNQRCFYASMISNRWVAIRLELVGAFIVFFASLFAVLGRDTLSGGLVGLTVTYALGITGSLNWLVRMLVELETNVVAVERVQEYTVVPTEAPRIIPHKRPDPSWPTYGEVVFRNYSTKYREGLPPVLNGINATIGAGQKVGIVGRTGAGKSSLTLALFRILEPTEGSIIIDGLDITEIGLADLRSRITIIPQEPILFSGSLKMNLDPFLEHNDDVLWKALEHAHLKQYVKGLPAGLEHEISEGGSNLSVGQRQLVCLARALLRRTKILVLDEATAAIDLETDELIQTAIRTQFKDCTVITIAHRINTIMDSDKVMVLSGGCIKEFEAPEKLLEDPNSLFTKLAKDAGLVSANGNGNGTSKTA